MGGRKKCRKKWVGWNGKCEERKVDEKYEEVKKEGMDKMLRIGEKGIESKDLRIEIEKKEGNIGYKVGEKGNLRNELKKEVEGKGIDVRREEMVENEEKVGWKIGKRNGIEDMVRMKKKIKGKEG